MLNFTEISKYLLDIRSVILSAYNEVHSGYYHVNGEVFLTGESLRITFRPNTSGIGQMFNIPVEVLSSKDKLVAFFKKKEEEGWRKIFNVLKGIKKFMILRVN